MSITRSFIFACQGPHGMSTFFFFNDTATTEISSLSLHDALPICQNVGYSNFSQPQSHLSFCVLLQYLVEAERKKRRSEDGSAGMPRPISYAVFCLKKKKIATKPNNVSLYALDD